MNSSPFILECKDLHVRKGGSLVLDIPYFGIQEGEILSLIGSNGAGKTTFLQTLAQLIKLSRGEIFFKGEKISNHSNPDYRKKMTMVFQEPLLFDTTVFGNVAAGLKIRGWAGPEIQEAVSANLERFGISQLLHRSAKKISGGEAQRVALARAFATRPEILFLDEPFSSLDPPSRDSLMEDLERILRHTRTTTIFATHDRLEALRLSDRMAIMNGGRILQIGPPVEMMNHPASEFVASFVGIDTILTGKVIRKEQGVLVVSISDREIEAIGEAEVGHPVALCIRPEYVTLSIHSLKEASSARNVFSGKIEKIIPMGPYYKVLLECGFPLFAYVTGQSMENLSLEPGREVLASFKATSIHVVKKKELSRPS